MLAVFDNQFLCFGHNGFMADDPTGLDVFQSERYFPVEPFAVFGRLAGCLAGGFYDGFPLLLQLSV